MYFFFGFFFLILFRVFFLYVSFTALGPIQDDDATYDDDDDDDDGDDDGIEGKYANLNSMEFYEIPTTTTITTIIAIAMKRKDHNKHYLLYEHKLN